MGLQEIFNPKGGMEEVPLKNGDIFYTGLHWPRMKGQFSWLPLLNTYGKHNASISDQPQWRLFISSARYNWQFVLLRQNFGIRSPTQKNGNCWQRFQRQACPCLPGFPFAIAHEEGTWAMGVGPKLQLLSRKKQPCKLKFALTVCFIVSTLQNLFLNTY